MGESRRWGVGGGDGMWGMGVEMGAGTHLYAQRGSEKAEMRREEDGAGQMAGGGGMKKDAKRAVSGVLPGLRLETRIFFVFCAFLQLRKEDEF